MKIQRKPWRKMVSAVLTALFLSLGVYAEDWLLFGKSSSATLYLDRDSIKREPTKTSLCLKYVFTTQGRAQFRSDAKVDPLYSKEIIELSLDQKARVRSMVLYGKDDAVLYERSQAQPWRGIELGDNLDLVWRYVFRVP